MQATVGAIVSGGAADVDGRLLVGDEITHINHHSVMDASHRDVIGLMGQAAAHGEVVLGIRRKMPIPDTLSPTSGVGGGFGMSGPGSLGFETKMDPPGGVEPGVAGADELDSGAHIPQGVREVVVSRPNVQTSFGFVLQSNTLRAGCMICEYSYLNSSLSFIVTLGAGCIICECSYLNSALSFSVTLRAICECSYLNSSLSFIVTLRAGCMICECSYLNSSLSFSVTLRAGCMICECSYLNSSLSFYLAHLGAII